MGASNGGFDVCADPKVLELKPDDGPTKFYLERIEDLSRQQLPDNWVTHTILKEK